MRSISKIVLRIAGCITAVAVLTLAYVCAPHVRLTIVSLTFLLPVLFISAAWGIRYAIFESVIAMLTLDYFFLPPVHSFRLDDPSDLIALLVFLTTGITASELTERARRNQRELRNVVNTVPAEIWSTSPDGAVEFVNARCLEFAGLPAKDALKLKWESLVHPDDRRKFAAAWQVALNGRQPMEIEVRVRCADGGYRWQLYRDVPMLDERGEVIRWYGTCFDIEDRKRAEQQSLQSEALLAEAQNLSHTGSFYWKVSTDEHIWSEETYRIWEYDPSTRITMNLVVERVHPEDREARAQAIGSVGTGQEVDMEYRLLFPNGSIKHVHLVYHAVRTESGETEVFGAVTDVTVRKRAEDALREQANLLNLTHDAILVQDMNGIITYWNHGAEELYGWTAEEAVGKRAFDLLKTLLPLSLDQIEAEVVRTGRWEGEVLHTRKDGTPLTSAGRWSLKRDEQNRPVAILVSNDDITKRKQAAEALRLSEYLAHGQLEALRQALSSLSQESEPERFFEHVLRFICRLLKGHSLTVWEWDGEAAELELAAILQEGRLEIPSKDRGQVPLLGLSRWWDEHPVWRQFSHSCESCIYGEIDTNPVKVRVATSQSGPWYDEMEMVEDASIRKSIEHIAALGIVMTLAIPLVVSGRTAGMLSIRFKRKREFRREEIELARAMTHQAMLALQLMRLSQQSRDAAVVAERNRMARDIHDTLAQGFTGIIMQLEAARGELEQNHFDGVADRIERIRGLATSSLAEARRSIRALRPGSLHDRTLSQAMEDLLKHMSDGTGLTAEFESRGDVCSIPPGYEETLLRIVQESLTNTIKHAGAGSLRVILSANPGSVELKIADNGKGFDVEAKHDGFGLLGMAERVENLGGTFVIQSTANTGTEILVVFQTTNS